MSEPTGNPYDINGPHFNSDFYLQKLYRECNLKQVMDKEAEVVRETHLLHSDMQTLVYENYNKFISATDTIKKMKSDFKKMEDEMDLLATNMDSITSFSEQISGTLQDTRQQISRLSGVHSLLKRLQFLFKLPNKLKSKIQQRQYDQAVQDYIRARRVLEQYGHMPSFQGIYADCEAIVDELKTLLRAQFRSKESSAKELAEAIDFLLQLNEPADSLCADFLSHAETRLSDQLKQLSELKDNDIIEFVDLGSSGFLSDLCLVVTSYKDMFINRPRSMEIDGDFEDMANTLLTKFIQDNMERYLSLVQSRVEREQDGGDTAVLVRALDRFHRRIQASSAIFPQSDFLKIGSEIVISAARRQCRFHLQTLKSHFGETLAKVRQSLATPRLINQNENESNTNLTELLSSLVLTSAEKVKGVLQDLLVFSQSDLTFSLKSDFRESFCVDNVREGLVVGFLHHLTATARGFCSSSDSKAPATLLLLLSKMCLEFEASTVHYLLSSTDEWFLIETQKDTGLLTNETELCINFRNAAQALLNHYVRVQGSAVSQMLRKSVETRDWLNTIEPRTVRAVMKRVVEDLTAVETLVGALYEEGTRAERSSDSSRRTHSVSVSRQPYRSNWSSYGPNQLESSIASNIQKLFSERIEIFSSVEFSKTSILTGIIKISLKTFLECVRLRTFSKYGFQQIQVDTHYLHLYLWRFVADENLVQCLLEEILSSANHRCIEPALMEHSVVDIICERG